MLLNSAACLSRVEGTWNEGRKNVARGIELSYAVPVAVARKWLSNVVGHRALNQLSVC